MLLCHCQVVNDRDVRAAIAAGARDEFDVAAMCGAGAACGGCVPAVTALLDEANCAAGCPLTAARTAGSDLTRAGFRSVAAG